MSDEEKFLADLQEANTAIASNPNDSMAHIRRGMATYNLEEYEEALSAFNKAIELEPSLAEHKIDNIKITTRINNCKAELKLDNEPSTNTSNTTTPIAPPVTQPVAPIPTPAPTPKIRHEWYQNNTHVFVSVFNKGTKKENLNVEFTENTLSVTIKLGDGNEFVLDLDLCDSIDPAGSSYEVLSTKVEVKLKKQRQVKWNALEGNPKAPNTTATRLWDAPSSTATTQKEPTKKNWDKIVKDTVPEEELDERDGLNKLFQSIYAGGTDEQRRAMVKSFTESGGTVLSCDWNEVGKDKVKVSPPTGMEPKTYEK
eukprot:TRINITY_DN1873_c0_g2_i1.p1 TRINITY_DN1873_c0_g2~~TRINITY_DN1873_c0_g2_i1.p1  ORF type:complete len:367 (+),score=99.19 TRINITY_DN1873_c0_g2_i1:166-1101(+)